jgi:hypothetical protein
VAQVWHLLPELHTQLLSVLVVMAVEATLLVDMQVLRLVVTLYLMQ